MKTITVKDFEMKMKSDIEEIFTSIISNHKNILPINTRARGGADISDYLEDAFVQYFETNKHPRIYNVIGAPKANTKNPYDFCFNYKDPEFEFDDLIWADIKATKSGYKDSNPDLGTPTKMIKFMLDGHFYLLFVFFEYEGTGDGQTQFIKFPNGKYVKTMFLKDIHRSVRINPKPQFQVNINEPEEYRTKEEFINLFLQKYKESNERIIKIQMKKKEELDIIFNKIKEVQLNKKD